MKELKLSISVLILLLLSSTYTFSNVVFEDDFETDKGWSLVNTSSKGNWERADPQGTTYQLNVSPGAGYYALVTDGRGGSDSYYDVDGGKTAIQSPEVQLPSSGNITISFYYYLGHRYDAQSIDYFRVKIKTGSSETVILEELANNGEDQPSSYGQFNTSLNNFAGQAIRVLIEAADNSGTILEASVDELKIESESGILPQVYETPNYPSNYPNYVNETETIGKHPDWGCSGYEIQVIGESEDNYDFLYLKQNGQNICDPIHGDLGTEGITVVVESDDPVDVTFTSDRYVTEQGFHVEAFESPGCQAPPSDMVACRYSYGLNAGGVTLAHPDDAGSKYLIGGWYTSTGGPATVIETDRLGQQVDVFQKDIPNENEDHVRNLATVPSGGYIVPVEHTVFRLENDINDTPIWSYPIPNPGELECVSAVLCTYDGGFLIGTSFGRIFKLTSGGVLDTDFNSPYGFIELSQSPDWITCLFETNDEEREYIVVTGGWPGNMYASANVFTVTRVSLAGVATPKPITSGSGYYVGGGSSGIQTSDGGFVFSCCTPIDETTRSAFMVKTDRDLNTEFIYEYPGLQSAIGVSEAKSGEYVLACVTNSIPSTGLDFALIRTNRLGNPLDDQPLLFPGNNDDGSC